MPSANLNLANEFANEYDQKILNNNWTAPAVLYSSLEKELIPGQNLLDLGIGTGASSFPFKERGLAITGIDGSEKMIDVCRGKNIADLLIRHNLEKPPLPLRSKSFDIVISVGVFHLIHPINHLFPEIERILKKGGFFGFTFDEFLPGEDHFEITPGTGEKITESGVMTYRHKIEFISELLNGNGLKETKKIRFLAFSNKELNHDFYFTCLIAKKN